MSVGRIGIFGLIRRQAWMRRTNLRVARTKRKSTSALMLGRYMDRRVDCLPRRSGTCFHDERLCRIHGRRIAAHRSSPVSLGVKRGTTA